MFQDILHSLVICRFKRFINKNTNISVSPVYIYIIYIYTSWHPLFADHWTIWRWNISHKYNWGRHWGGSDQSTESSQPTPGPRGKGAEGEWRTTSCQLLADSAGQAERVRQKKSHQDEVGRRQPQKWADLCELRGEAIRGLTSQTNLQMKFILPPSEKIAFWRGGENIWRVSPPHWRNICK